eukprot:UN4380
MPRTEDKTAITTWQVGMLQKLQDSGVVEETVQTLGPFHISVVPYSRGGTGTRALGTERRYAVLLEVTFPHASELDFGIEAYHVSVRVLSAKRVRAESFARSPAPSPGPSSIPSMEESTGRGQRRRTHRRGTRSGTRASMERHCFTGSAETNGSADVAPLRTSL